MIILLGVYDLITVLLSFYAIYSNIELSLVSLLLFFLLIKGVWTLIVTKNLLDPLGLLDLITGLTTILAVNYGMLITLSQILLSLSLLKSLFSIIRFS